MIHTLTRRYTPLYTLYYPPPPQQKGWKPETRITFKEEGDQGPNNVAGNVVHAVRKLTCHM